MESGLIEAAAHDDWNSPLTPLRLPPHLAQRILDTRTLVEGERKQITVLFADIKGSTALIEGLDPEDADLRLRPALDAMIRAVHRYEGTINRVQGDGIMALFGAPLAHEDSAVRAAYAAIDMLQDVRSTCDPDIAVRVGLHTGEVLVRAIHNDLSVNYDAIGPTVHLAARMEQMATPGTIYCTADLMRAAAGFIDATTLGLVSVKGVRQPIDLYEIVGRTAARTRWEVTSARQMTPFIGRKGELARLRHAFELADAGQGQIVAVRGQPGTGKSRLVHELVESAILSGWTVLKTAAVEFQRGAPYLAVASLLRAWCDIVGTASVADTQQRLRSSISALPSDPSISLAALQSLLDLPIADTDWLALEPAMRRQRMMTSVKQIFLHVAATGRLLLWLEDLQWTDVESRDILDALVEQLDASRLFLVATFRPEHLHKWADKTNFDEIHLERLSPAAAGKFVEALLGSGNAELRALIVTRTEGIPLFIEETVRTLIDNGTLHSRADRYELTREIHEIRIPESMQSVIAARIDSLPPRRKALLQVASVIGADIPVKLLGDVVELGGTEFQTPLAELKAAQFLYEKPNATSLMFKHAFVHDVAYGSMVATRRQTLHSRVLRCLEAENRDDVQIGSLAYHALNASRWGDAVKYLCQAGDRAIELSAYREASSLFDQALQALTHLPQDGEHVRQSIDIRLKLRQVFGATAEYDRLAHCLAEAETLAIAIDDRGRLASINVARSFVHNFRGELDASIQCGLRARSIAREIGNGAVGLSASFYLGQAYMWRGDFREAVSLLEANLAWIDGPLRHQRSGTTGTGSVLWLGMLGASQGRLGNFQAAIDATQKACLIANEVQRPADIAVAYWWAGFVWSYKGDVAQALKCLEHGFEVCRSSQINYLIPILSTSLGYAYALAGRTAEGIALLTKAETYSRGANFTYGEAWSSVYLGFAKLLSKSNEDLYDRAENVLALARKHKYRAIEVDALRLLGEIHKHAGTAADEDAKRYYSEASDKCLELGLQPEYVRCQIGLGQILLRANQRAEAAKLFEASRQRCQALDLLLPDIDLDRIANINSD